MKFQKRYIVLAALVLALGTAVYVNWQVTGADTGRVKELGQASYVNATVSSNATEDEAVQTAVLTKEQQDYFATERNKRQQMQDKVIDDAKEIFDIENVAEDERTDAENSVAETIRNFTVQDSIESIIKAKGFTDCMCSISSDGVTVIVPKEELNDKTVLVIDDAVTSHYQTDYDKISIVGV